MGCASSAPAEAAGDAAKARANGNSNAGGSSSDPTTSYIIKERDNILGASKFLARADELSTSVLPLANAFDHFDVDRSAGLSVDELRGALSHLGIETDSETAGRILKQYDAYPDAVIDVKEFATIVRDIKLMLAFDANGDGVIDADELLPLLRSLGVKVEPDQVQSIMNRFDVDKSGAIDLVELSSIVRTAQAFVRYDTDESGAIDIDELRDALRKLGLKAGALEAQALFSRYDADGNGTIELDEFAVLVRDLQLYASYDDDCNGTIDPNELMRALRELGLESHPAAQSESDAKEVLQLWDADGDGGLNISEFTKWASDARAFREADVPSGDNKLDEKEFIIALKSLGVEPPKSSEAFPKYAENGMVTLLGWGRATWDLVDSGATFGNDGVVLSAEGSKEKGRAIAWTSMSFGGGSPKANTLEGEDSNPSTLSVIHNYAATRVQAIQRGRLSRVKLGGAAGHSRPKAAASAGETAMDGTMDVVSRVASARHTREETMDSSTLSTASSEAASSSASCESTGSDASTVMLEAMRREQEAQHGVNHKLSQPQKTPRPKRASRVSCPQASPLPQTANLAKPFAVPASPALKTPPQLRHSRESAVSTSAANGGTQPMTPPAIAKLATPSAHSLGNPRPASPVGHLSYSNSTQADSQPRRISHEEVNVSPQLAFTNASATFREENGRVLLVIGGNRKASFSKPRSAGEFPSEVFEVFLNFDALNDTTETKSKRRETEKTRGRLLESAAQNGQTSMVELLLEAGASLGASERSVLACAIEAGNPDIVRLLLDARARLDTGPGEPSLIETAVKTGQLEMLRLLLDAGAPLSGGLANPLRLAVEGRNLEMARRLLEAGAALEACEEGSKPLLQIAFDANNRTLVKMLLDAGASRTDVKPAVLSFACQTNGSFKWSGIASLGVKMYCAPYNANDVLVIDAEDESMLSIPCGVDGKLKYAGVAAVGTKLFCAPYSASEVLVIDSETDTTRTIQVLDTDFAAKSKYYGIAAVGTKLYCAPFDADNVLVINAETEDIYTIPIFVQGSGKYYGITAVGTKLYCAPCNASGVLVIDAETEETHTIPCGGDGQSKWNGIAAVGGKLFCAPCNSSYVLVIDVETEAVRKIGCGAAGTYKWTGIAASGDKLICAPCSTDDLLVIDADVETVMRFSCGLSGAGKWNGIASCGNSFFCAPNNAHEVLTIEDRLSLWGL